MYKYDAISISKKFFEDIDDDQSYLSPERELLCRLEDLLECRREMNIRGNFSGKNKKENFFLSENDIRYAIPEFFKDIRHVEKAIDFAISDLREKYDINVIEELTDNDVPLVGQLYFEGLNLIEFKLPYKAA